MNTKQAYIQLVGDALIPLAGVFFFDWSLYFILLFYCLDLIASEVVSHLKSKKTVEFNGISKKPWLVSGVKSALLLIVSLASIHVAVYAIHPEMNFQQAFIEFMSYEEMGIAQGYILIPFVAFAAYQLYRMDFLMPAKYRTIDLQEIWKPHTTALIIIILAAYITVGVSQLIVFSDLVYVLSIVGVSSMYQLWIIRRKSSKR